MRMARRQLQPFHLASFSMPSWIALLLAFMVATQTFWCGLGGSDCDCDFTINIAQVSTVTSSPAVVHGAIVSASNQSPLRQADVCSNVDETKNHAVFAGLSFIAPLLLLVTIVYVMAALVMMPLPRRAAVFGRDGPVSVPPLHSRLVRASLPHRAPPVFLF